MNKTEEQATDIVDVTPQGPTFDVNRLKRAMRGLDQLKREVATPDDFATIQGKEVPTRSFCRKMQLAANISDRIIEKKREDRDDGSFVWFVTVEAETDTGRVSTGVGACDSRERQFAHVEHDVLATAHTRAKSRAVLDMVAGGIVSYEEMQGTSMTTQSQAEPPADRTSTISTEQVILVLKDRDLDVDEVDISDTDMLKVTIKGSLGDTVFDKYNAAMREIGLRYTNEGGARCWIPEGERLR